MDGALITKLYLTKKLVKDILREMKLLKIITFKSNILNS